MTIHYRIATSDDSTIPGTPATAPSPRQHDEPDDSGGKGWVIVAAAAAVVGLGVLGAVVISATSDTADEPDPVQSAGEVPDVNRGPNEDLPPDPLAVPYEPARAVSGAPGTHYGAVLASAAVGEASTEGQLAEVERQAVIAELSRH